MLEFLFFSFLNAVKLSYFKILTISNKKKNVTSKTEILALKISRRGNVEIDGE